jgi:hypothetical protein
MAMRSELCAAYIEHANASMHVTVHTVVLFMDGGGVQRRTKRCSRLSYHMWACFRPHDFNIYYVFDVRACSNAFSSRASMTGQE